MGCEPHSDGRMSRGSAKECRSGTGFGNVSRKTAESSCPHDSAESVCGRINKSIALIMLELPHRPPEGPWQQLNFKSAYPVAITLAHTNMKGQIMINHSTYPIRALNLRQRISLAPWLRQAYSVTRYGLAGWQAIGEAHQSTETMPWTTRKVRVHTSIVEGGSELLDPLVRKLLAVLEKPLAEPIV